MQAMEDHVVIHRAEEHAATDEVNHQIVQLAQPRDARMVLSWTSRGPLQLYKEVESTGSREGVQN